MMKFFRIMLLIAVLFFPVNAHADDAPAKDTSGPVSPVVVAPKPVLPKIPQIKIQKVKLFKSSPAVAGGVAIGNHWRERLAELEKERKQMLETVEKMRQMTGDNWRALINGRVDLNGDGLISQEEVQLLAAQLKKLRPSLVKKAEVPKVGPAVFDADGLRKMRTIMKVEDMRSQSMAGRTGVFKTALPSPGVNPQGSEKK